MVPAWTAAPEPPKVFPGCTYGVSGPTGGIRGARAKLTPGRFTAPRYSDFEPDLNNLWAVKLSPLPGSTRGKQLLAALEDQLNCVFLAGVLGDMSSDLQWLLQSHQAAEGPSQAMGVEEKPAGSLCCIEILGFVAASHPRRFLPRQKRCYSIQDGEHKAGLALVQHTRWTRSAWEWAVNRPRLLWSAAGGQRCPETAAEPSPARSTSGSCLRISL